MEWHFLEPYISNDPRERNNDIHSIYSKVNRAKLHLIKILNSMLWIGRFGLDRSSVGVGQLRLSFENGLQDQLLIV